MALDLPDVLIYALGVFIAATLNFIVAYTMWKIKEIDKVELLIVSYCDKIDLLAKIRRWIHGIFTCFLLVIGHRVLFLINVPMLAWEIYEAHAEREHMISAKEFFQNEIPLYCLYFCFFTICFCIYLDLLIHY